MSDSLVIIPTYNEIENIEPMIRTVFGLPKAFHVLIVDDGSPDGTADVVKRLQQEFPESLHLMQRKGKLGLGTAYIAGFKWALERHYGYIFEMDCDFSHDPKDLVRLYEGCTQKGGDVTVGSRYTKGGQVENWPWHRLFISKGAGIYVNVVLGLGVQDATAGFVCYRRAVLQKLNLDGIRFIGYAFQIEMKYKSKKTGFKIVEVPILFKDRLYGVSKMSMNIFKEAFVGVLQMRFSSDK